MERNIRVVQARLQPTHRESVEQRRANARVPEFVHELVAVGPGGLVAAGSQSRDQLDVAVPRRHLDRGVVPSTKIGFSLIQEPEMRLRRRGRRLKDDVAGVVDDKPREIALVEPLTYPERPVARSTEEPLQTAGVNERVRVGGRTRTSDKSEQRPEVALAVERTFEEVAHGNP